MPRPLVPPVAILIGTFLHTIVFLLFDLVAINLTQGAMLAAAAVAAIATHVAWRRVRLWYASLAGIPTFRFTLYDGAMLVILAMIMFIPVWASWYWPVTPFDAMAGIDLVARTAVAEGRIDNSVFTDPALQGRLSNQPFYAPFTMLMQVITRLMGFPFGQVWLGLVAVLHVWILWATSRRLVSPFLANAAVLLMVMTPEVHGYMYLLQTDFLNSVVMTLGIVAMMLAVRDREVSWLAVSAVGFAAACWSRTESIVIVMLGLGLTWPLLRRTFGKSSALRWTAGIAGSSFLCFALWHILYFNVVLPQRPDTASELVFPTFDRVFAVASTFAATLYGEVGFWGWTFILGTVVLVANAALNAGKRASLANWSGDKVVWLWVVAIILGLTITGVVFSAAIVEQTLRRGIFKLVPLMYLLVITTPMVQAVGRRIEKWERPTTS